MTCTRSQSSASGPSSVFPAAAMITAREDLTRPPPAGTGGAGCGVDLACRCVGSGRAWKRPPACGTWSGGRWSPGGSGTWRSRALGERCRSCRWTGPREAPRGRQRAHRRPKPRRRRRGANAGEAGCAESRARVQWQRSCICPQHEGQLSEKLVPWAGAEGQSLCGRDLGHGQQKAQRRGSGGQGGAARDVAQEWHTARPRSIALEARRMISVPPREVPR